MIMKTFNLLLQETCMTGWLELARMLLNVRVEMEEKKRKERGRGRIRRKGMMKRRSNGIL